LAPARRAGSGLADNRWAGKIRYSWVRWVPVVHSERKFQSHPTVPPGRLIGLLKKVRKKKLEKTEKSCRHLAASDDTAATSALVPPHRVRNLFPAPPTDMPAAAILRAPRPSKPQRYAQDTPRAVETIDVEANNSQAIDPSPLHCRRSTITSRRPRRPSRRSPRLPPPYVDTGTIMIALADPIRIADPQSKGQAGNDLRNFLAWHHAAPDEAATNTTSAPAPLPRVPYLPPTAAGPRHPQGQPPVTGRGPGRGRQVGSLRTDPPAPRSPPRDPGRRRALHPEHGQLRARRSRRLPPVLSPRQLGGRRRLAQPRTARTAPPARPRARPRRTNLAGHALSPLPLPLTTPTAGSSRRTPWGGYDSDRASVNLPDPGPDQDALSTPASDSPCPSPPAATAVNSAQ
jgi:hypothetical protein